MSRALVNYLSAIRRQVRMVAERVDSPDDQLALDQVGTILSRLITDAREGVPAGDPLDAEVAADASERARAVVLADRAYFRAREAALEAELHAGRASSVVAPGDDDEFDIRALREFIAHTIEDDGPVEITDVRVPSRGFSKKTLLLSLRGNKVLPDEVVVRLDQLPNHFGTTVVDEYPLLELLAQYPTRVPSPYALESSGDVLGAPFIVVPKLPGTMVGHVYAAPPRDEALNADAAACLAAIHAVPIEALGHHGEQVPAVDAHLERELRAIRDDWQSLDATSVTIDAAFEWVAANLPRSSRRTIVHNDFNYHNLLVEGSRITAVLDWEFSHLGDPAADLGYFYYSAEGVASYGAFLSAYEQSGGSVPPRAALDFYILWGQLRLAVMVFQVDHFFRVGLADDLRYALSGTVNRYNALNRISTKLEELLDRSS